MHGTAPSVPGRPGRPHRSAANLLWATGAVSDLGDGIRVAALPLLAAAITRSPLQVSGITVAIWLPWLLFGLHSGGLVDRLDRARLLRDVQLTRLVVTATLAGLVATGHASIPLLYAAAFVVGIGQTLADGVLQALVPLVVAGPELERINGRMSAAETVSNQCAGPVAGGLLFVLAPALPFSVDAVSFGASAAIAARLRRALPVREAVPSPGLSLLAQIRQGVRYVARHRILGPMALWVSSLNLFFTMAHGVLVLYSVEVLHLGGAGYGLLLSAAGAGALAAAALSPRVVGWLGRGRTMLASSMLAALATMATGLTGHAYLVGLCQFLGGLSAVSFTIVGRSLRQSLSPEVMIGRISNTYRMLAYGMIPVGALLGGWEAAALGIHAPFLTAGAGVLGVSAAAGVWLRRGAVDRRPGETGA